jgi:hypothetical protein
MVVLAFATPRLVVALLWLFTQWFHGIFSTALLPVLGFFFLPTTLLWYTAVQHWFDGQWTLVPIAGMVLAIMIDLAPTRARRRRAAQDNND